MVVEPTGSELGVHVMIEPLRVQPSAADRLLGSTVKSDDAVIVMTASLIGADPRLAAITVKVRTEPRAVGSVNE